MSIRKFPYVKQLVFGDCRPLMSRHSLLHVTWPDRLFQLRGMAGEGASARQARGQRGEARDLNNGFAAGNLIELVDRQLASIIEQSVGHWSLPPWFRRERSPSVSAKLASRDLQNRDGTHVASRNLPPTIEP